MNQERMSNLGHDLVAVLDWGLGHASRCVPVIEHLLDAGREVTIASAGSALVFLQEHFPALPVLELPAYRVRYPFRSMAVNLGFQGPRIAYVVWEENRRIRAAVAERGITRIISDGRFGCWHPTIASVWLAHQLQIQHKSKAFAQLINTGYHQYIRSRFQGVWVPDQEQEPRLAGRLSAPIGGLPHRYLGPCSRYAKTGSAVEQASPVYRYVVLLSGPEPQRSRLEEQLRTQLIALDESCLLIRGVPGSSKITTDSGRLSKVDWLLGEDLLMAVQQANTIICRSGYSTLMDAWYWQKPLLLIPTPGQTEQEYLARYWAERGWAAWYKQNEVQLSEKQNPKNGGGLIQ